VWFEGAEVSQRLVGDHLARPTHGRAGVGGEHVERDRAGHHQVVIARQRQVGTRADEIGALIGLGAIADQIAEAPQLVDSLGVDGREHRLEGSQIRVHVRDDCDSHRQNAIGRA
jgi:hypothetical protein